MGTITITYPAGSTTMSKIELLAAELHVLSLAVKDQSFFDAIDSAELVDLAKLFVQLKGAHGTIKESSTNLGKVFDSLRLTKIPEKMDEQGISGAKFEGLGRLTLTSDVHASIKAGMKPQAQEWLDDHGHSDLVQETVNSSSLKALAKVYIKQGENLPEEFFNVSPITRANITKA